MPLCFCECFLNSQAPALHTFSILNQLMHGYNYCDIFHLTSYGNKVINGVDTLINKYFNDFMQHVG